MKKNNFFFNAPLRSKTLNTQEEALQKVVLAGKRLKERRRELGISRSNLTIRTKISVTVIEAIENGWIKQLPEKTYLAKMLYILEKELELEKNTFNPFLELDSPKKLSKVKIFTPGNIDFIYTWHGSLIYIILILISILIINKQQSYLSIKKTQTTSPIIDNKIVEDLK